MIIFGSVQFLPLKNNQTGRQKKGTQTEPELVQTDRFRFGLGPVFEVQNQKNLWLFFWLCDGLLMGFVMGF